MESCDNRTLVFLDIDGVLHTQERVQACLSETPDPQELLARSASPEALQGLESFCRRRGAEIVVTSTWRKVLPHPGVRDAYRRAGVDLPIIGDTPLRHGGLAIRESEVLDWLEAHEPPEVRMVIFDDRPEPFQRLAEFLIQPEVGEAIADDEWTRAEQVLDARCWPTDMR